MVQRIQTLFLLIAFLLVGSLFFMPFVNLLGMNNEFYELSITGVNKIDAEGQSVVTNTMALSILVGAINVLLLLTIFLFKNRVLQMRLCIYNMLLLVGSLVLGFYFFKQISQQVETPNHTFTVAVTFPLLAIILIYLAFRNIRRDELLVRSVDRIR
jgi:hypothetical protein